MILTPIKLPDYVRLHLKSNRGSKEAEVTAELQSALAAYKAGKRCSCGAPIWVIGSSQTGHMCFTCITGETDASDD
jgi:dihydrofolate reductase